LGNERYLGEKGTGGQLRKTKGKEVGFIHLQRAIVGQYIMLLALLVWADGNMNRTHYPRELAEPL
jgi:hypothetical protein